MGKLLDPVYFAIVAVAGLLLTSGEAASQSLKDVPGVVKIETHDPSWLGLFKLPPPQFEERVRKPKENETHTDTVLYRKGNFVILHHVHMKEGTRMHDVYHSIAGLTYLNMTREDSRGNSFTRKTEKVFDFKQLPYDGPPKVIRGVSAQDLSFEYKWDIFIRGKSRHFTITYELMGVTTETVTVNGKQIKLDGFIVRKTEKNRYKIWKSISEGKYIPGLGALGYRSVSGKNPMIMKLMAKKFTPTSHFSFKVSDKVFGKLNAPQALASRDGDPAKAPETSNKAAPSDAFPTAPVDVRFRIGETRPDDIAVIIGNSDYRKYGKDIPNVTPAYADSEGFKLYVMQALGVREGNIIHLKDATSAQMVGVFGNERSHKGKLFNWTKPNVSKVYVYYAGHGAPAGDDGSPYLVPSDADSEVIELNGYPLTTLYRNLAKIPAKSITVVLESCFSGASQEGGVISNASPVYLKAKTLTIPPNITVISAGKANQMASWEKDKSHSLFTKYFLKGMSGEADAKPYGDGDGHVGYDELGRYLEGTMTYYARRYYGRDQTAVIVVGGSR